MRNLHELFEEVCEALYELGIDPQDLVTGESDACQAAAAIRVYGAYQPRYPLAGSLQSLTVLHPEEDDDDRVVWLSVGYAPNDINPYAPHELFEAY
jgi:hypothetical protein